MPVKVYSYKLFDIDNSQSKVSEYFATEEVISLFEAEITDRSNFYFVSMDDLDGDGRIHKDKLQEILNK
ncbi:hypothetical protein [Polynucleobacter sphagniphilus]|uniref:hypothetical protein n=1 Tax=Polynucleobacter sphagniphilus TaxID=1743169 RepID=UPI00096B6B10|nr:hypothetical protein [Polynucleobacter sphagniphilus]OLY96411.1 hypothetical protein BOQ04_04530 [Polynucleobacter sphagniphilus]